MPFFSIIIPTFNSSASLRQALDSVLQQSFDDLEVWVIDGQSRDNTIEIVHEYQVRDQRLKYIAEPDKGIYDAMNKGIGLAKGEWLYFLGSDDALYDQGVLETVVKASAVTSANVVYGNVLIVGDTSWAKDGDVHDGAFDFDKLIRKNICHQAIFYNRAFINRAGRRYNLKYRLLADWDFNLQCFAASAFHYCDMIVAKFHGGGQTTAENKDIPFETDFFNNILTYFKLTPFDKRMKQLPDYFLPEVYDLQRKQSMLRYYYGKVKRKIL